MSRNDQSTQCICPICADETYTPICGDNGKSYANKCWLKRDSCMLQKNINIAKDSLCGVYGTFDVLFLVDGSNNVDQNSLNKIKTFLETAAKSYQLSMNNARIGLVVFGNTVKQHLHIASGISQKYFQQALLEVRPIGGKRQINLALKLVNNELFTQSAIRPSSRQILVLVTTGKDESNNELVSTQYAKSLKSKGVKIITVVIGDDSVLNYAKEISSSKQNVIFVENDLTQLPGILGDVERHVGDTQGKNYFPIL